ncbi:MAG: alpha-2-macroglobulin family protein [Pirellulales bacterium]
MWVSDTSIVRKNVEKGQWFYVADAITGKPLPGINLELFGYRHENPQTPNGRPRVIVSNFAKKTGSDGQVYLDEKESLNGGQWMSIARSAEGRLSVIGMEGLWNNGRLEQWFTQLKAYGVCDQPVHRPGDKLKAHFWLATAGYNPDIASSPATATECTVQLMDPQGKVFWQGKKQTDEFGRISLEIDLPPSATLGLYRFQLTSLAHGWLQPNLTVRVEEFRKPEFEVKIAAPDKPVKLGDKIEARISAKYYFGSPVTDAYVNVKVTRRAYADNWFPVRPYDWCYGPGYWWTCYDTPWFPRWNLWRGCIGPTPPWFPNHGFEPPESVMDQEVTLDAKGEAMITIDSSTAAAIYGDQDHQYNISVEVRDASRRTITASGSVIAARQAYKIYSWLNRGYYRTGESGVATFQARTLSDSPIQGEGQIDLLRITYDADRKPIETVVQSWEARTDADGRVSQKFEAAAAGQYRIRLKLKSKEGEEAEGAYLFTIRGGNDSGDNYRYSALELITDKSEYAVGEKVQLQINADRNDAVVFLFVRPSNGAYPKPQLVQLKNKSNIVEIPVAAGDQPNFFVEAITVYGGEFHTAVREIIVPPEDRVLNVAIKTDQEEYLPGAESELEVTVTDGDGKPVSGSLAIAVYDRSLEQIAPDTLPGDIREFFWKWRRSHYPQSSENLSRTTGPGWVQDLPHYQPLGIFGYTLADELDTKHDVAIRSGSKRMNERFRAKGNVMLGAPMRSTGGFGGMGGGAEGMAAGAAPAAPASGAMYGLQSLRFDAASQASPAGSEPAQAQLRKDFADSALWLVGITSNSEGKAKAKFKMPENLGSWQIRAWALGSKTRVGSIASSVVTRKNILVRIAAPRFLVERDEVIVSGIVHNDLPDAHDVRIRFEIDGETQLELMKGEKAERVVNIKSHEQARVDWRCKATAEGKVKLRVIAETAVESDAMQIEVPIIVHGVLKTDSWAGTVRLDQEKSLVKVSIPAERSAEQSKLTVRMSPSLAAAMVDALPYMASYPYGCTEQTLNRFLPTVITQKLLREMNIDLKQVRDRRNNLNAQELGKVGDRVPDWKRFDDNPVFDAEEVAKMVEAGVRRLTDMQNQDGGWGWFSGSREYSSSHTTAVVVRGLMIARDNDAAIVPDVLERGLAWLESYQAKEVQKLRNAASKTNEYKNDPDNTDALIFNILVSAGRNTASNDIKDMQGFLFNRREVLSIYGKTLIAEAFHKLDNAEQSAAVRRNIEQFLVQDAENETAYLQDNAPWWYWYGSEIEANARYLQLLAKTDPKNPTAARLVKYLLNNRKHSTYWNSTRDTALVIEAFGDYLRASGETTGTVEAEVLFGGKRLGSVKFTPATLFETDGTIEITGNAVPSGEAELEIRRTGNGPLYWSVYSTNFTLEDEIAPAGLEVKIERRYTHLIPVQKSLELADAKAGVVSTERQAFERRPVQDLQQLPSGSLVEVELLVESKNDYEYLMIEERKAAGLEPIDTQSGYTYDALQVYREFREKHVAFFLHRLPRGKHSLKYQLRTEAPGKFTALPAVIQAMYAPELVGNSADFDVQIIDEGTAPKN